MHRLFQSASKYFSLALAFRRLNVCLLYTKISHSTRICMHCANQKTFRRLLYRRNKFSSVIIQTCLPNVAPQRLRSSSVRAPERGRSERPSTSYSQPSSAWNGTPSITVSRFGRSLTLRLSSTSTALHPCKLGVEAQRIPHPRLYRSRRHLCPHHVRRNELKTLRSPQCRRHLRLLHSRSAEVPLSLRPCMIPNLRRLRCHRAREGPQHHEANGPRNFSTCTKTNLHASRA
jgi:hypothetical protein